MADIQQLEESIVSLSLLEASALVKKLEERLGVSAAAAAVAAAPAAGIWSGTPARYKVCSLSRGWLLKTVSRCPRLSTPNGKKRWRIKRK